MNRMTTHSLERRLEIAHIFQTMEYGPAPDSLDAVTAWLDLHQRRFGLWIGGEWQSGQRSLACHAPRDGARLATIANASAGEVDAAVGAAHIAQPEWGTRSGLARSRLLHALARQLSKKSALLATLVSLEQGKPIRDARDHEIASAIRHLEHAAALAHMHDDEVRAPIGVVASILSSRSPVLELASRVGPALAAGNVVIIKPAAEAALSAILFAELCSEIGVPSGVVSVVTGDDETEDALANHRDIARLDFVGSPPRGRVLRCLAAESGKAVSLELESSAVCVVMSDVDLDSVVEGIVESTWSNRSGYPRSSRLLVQESIAEALIIKLRARLQTSRVGDPLDWSTDIGAVGSAKQKEHFEALIREAEDEGARVVRSELAIAEGFYVAPTLLLEVAPSMRITQVAVSGPVVGLMTFRTTAEAIALANNGSFGHSAQVWTERAALGLELAYALAVRTVHLNHPGSSEPAVARGGWRESGGGEIGGLDAVSEYSVPKMDASGARPRSRSRHSDPHGPLAIRATSSGSRSIRNAVEAARASAWTKWSPARRAKTLLRFAELTEARRSEVVGRTSESDFERSVERLFLYGHLADKLEGRSLVLEPQMTVWTHHEPWGILGVVLGDSGPPLLHLVTTLGAALAAGNAVVALAAPDSAWFAARLASVARECELPIGTLHFASSASFDDARVLAAHDAVDAIWYFGSPEGDAAIEKVSSGMNLRADPSTRELNPAAPDSVSSPLPTGIAKPSFCARDEGTFDPRDLLFRAARRKTIWIPFGE